MNQQNERGSAGKWVIVILFLIVASAGVYFYYLNYVTPNEPISSVPEILQFLKFKTPTPETATLTPPHTPGSTLETGYDEGYSANPETIPTPTQTTTSTPTPVNPTPTPTPTPTRTGLQPPPPPG